MFKNNKMDKKNKPILKFPTKFIPPTKFNPPQSKKVEIKKRKIEPTFTNNIDLSSLIPTNYERTKLSKDDFTKLFKNISDMKNKNIDDISNIIDLFIKSNNDENSFESAILTYLKLNYSYFDIKFIASMFIKTDIPTFAIFFDKFGRNKSLLDNERDITKFIKKFDKTGNYIKELRDFGEKNVIYKSLFNELATGLNKYLILQLLDGYLNQGNEFFRDYYSKVFVKEYKKQLDEFEKEKKEKKQKEEQQFLDRMEQTKLVRKMEGEIEKYNACKDLYKKIPWIPGNIITRICLNKPFIQKENEKNSSNFDDFIIESSKFFMNDDEWFEASEKYFQLQCDETFIKNQKNDVTYFFNSNSDLVVALKIGFSNANDDFIVQNEDIYNAERSFFANLNKTLNEVTVNNILDSPLTEDIFNIGRELFMNAISRVSSSSKYNSDINSFIQSDSTNVREFARSIGEIIIYLDIDNISDSIFKKRIQKEYYNRNVLFNLSMNDKIPEILCNQDNENYKSFIFNYINTKISNFIYRFGENIYIIQNKFTKEYKRKIFPNEDMEISMKYTSINKFCDATLNILPENLLLYTNKNQTKCFFIKDLIQNIKNNEFDDENFSKHIARIYDFENILNPKKIISNSFPIVNMIVANILDLDDSIDKYDLEFNLGLLTPEEIENEGEEEEEEPELEEEEENILQRGKELIPLNDEEEEADEEDEEEEEDEEAEEEAEADEEDEEAEEEEAGEVEEQDEDEEEVEVDEEGDVDEEGEEVDEDESSSEDEEDEIFEKEKLKNANKFNDYSGISETIYSNDKFSIERNYVKGNGDCFFRSLYLSIIYNNPKNFKLIPDELRPSKLICEKNIFKDVDEFSKKARQYIADNYDDVLNNIIEMGAMMTDYEIYPNSEDALFGEAGRCYIKYRGSKKFKKEENIVVKHKNKWEKGKIIKIKKVISDSNDEDKIYKIKLDNGEILRNVLDIDIMKKDSVNNFFKCAKKQILSRKIYPTYGEIDLIMNLLSKDFEIRNVILSNSYNIKFLKKLKSKSKLKIENGIDIKDILNNDKYVQNSFNIGEKVFFRKGWLKGTIIEDNNENTYKISTKTKIYKSVKLRNIVSLNNESLGSYDVNDNVLFRGPFLKGIIDSVVNDSTSNPNLSNSSKTKILNDIERYEENKDENKIQIYLLSDNIHYNFLSIDYDELEILQLNKDGKFTENLLNYLNKNIDGDDDDTDKDGGDDDDSTCKDGGDDDDDDDDTCKDGGDDDDDEYKDVGDDEDKDVGDNDDDDDDDDKYVGDNDDDTDKYGCNDDDDDDDVYKYGGDDYKDSEYDEDDDVNEYHEIIEKDVDDWEDDGNRVENLLNYLKKNQHKCQDGNCPCEEENIDGIEKKGDDGSKNKNKYSKYCEQCKLKIKSPFFFKTKNYNKKMTKIETIYFCSIRCFNIFDKWRKI